MGSPSNKAQTQAAQNQAWSQSQIDRSVGAINSAYSNPRREADIQDFLGASREYYGNELGRQKTIADRSTKFALARNGLTGGSAAIDANRLLGENYQQGVLNADRLAQGAAADLRSADEQSRLNLIAQAQQGADMTTSASQSASALRNNLASGNAGVKADALGDVFSGLSNIWTTSQNNAAQNRGYRDVYNLLYTPGFGYGGSK
jgi:hypothetical protein